MKNHIKIAVAVMALSLVSGNAYAQSCPTKADLALGIELEVNFNHGKTGYLPHKGFYGYINNNSNHIRQSNLIRKWQNDYSGGEYSIDRIEVFDFKHPLFFEKGQVGSRIKNPEYMVHLQLLNNVAFPPQNSLDENTKWQGEALLKIKQKTTYEKNATLSIKAINATELKIGKCSYNAVLFNVTGQFGNGKTFKYYYLPDLGISIEKLNVPYKAIKTCKGVSDSACFLE